MEQFKSRKFVLTNIGILLLFLLPIFYSKVGVSETVILTFGGFIAGLASVYNGANVRSKKYENADSDDKPEAKVENAKP